MYRLGASFVLRSTAGTASRSSLRCNKPLGCRQLSELYFKSIQSTGSKSKEMPKPQAPHLTAIPAVKIKDSSDRLQRSLFRDSKKQLAKDAEKEVKEYIHSLHTQEWDKDKAWLRFTRLSSMARKNLRLIDFNRTLSLLRESDNALKRTYGASKSQKLTRMMFVYDAAVAAGIAADRFTYQEMIAINVSLKDFVGARRWLSEMLERGIKPTIRPYRTLLKGYAKDPSEIDSARQLWQEIKRQIAAGQIISEDTGEDAMVETCVDFKTYNCMVGAECRAGYFAQALAILDEMAEAGLTPDITMRNTILDGVASHKGLDAALEEVALMKDNGMAPDAYTYNILFNAAASENRIDLIKQLLAEAAKKGFMPSAKVVQMLPIDPIETVDIISESGELDTIRVYNTLIRASMKNNQFSQVLQLIAHLRKHGVQPNVVTYGMLLDTLSKAGKLEQAKKMFHDIIEKGMIKPDLYIFSTMIDACGRNGDIKHMFYLKDQMAAYDLYPEEIIYNSILSAMSRQKRVDLRRVMAVVDELVKSEPPIYPTIRTFNPVVAAFASKARASGLGSDELQFLQTWYAKISDEYYVVKDSYMYGLAIEAFAASNRLDDAMDVYGEMMRHSETDVSVTRVFTSPSSRHIDMLTRLSIEQLRFDNALRLWRDWNALGAYVTESVAGIVLYACDQGGLFGIAHDIVVSLLTPPGSSSAGSKEAGSTSTSTSSNSDHVTRFNPKAVSEKTLMLYIGIAVKHNKLETIVPIMDLWRTSILASSEPASAEAASLAGIRTQLADIRSHRVLSEETVKNIVRLLSRSKDKDAANDVTGQVLVFVDKYFPEAVPV